MQYLNICNKYIYFLILSFCICLCQADMHGLLTFVLIPSTQSKPPPVKENVVSSESEQNFYQRYSKTVLA